jgi:DNA-binding HxlR family transcriptional regulator
VGVVLWYLRSLHNSMNFEFSSIEAERWGIAPDIKSRALRALQKAELISVEGKRGQNPKVTLLPRRRD